MGTVHCALCTLCTLCCTLYNVCPVEWAVGAEIEKYFFVRQIFSSSNKSKTLHDKHFLLSLHIFCENGPKNLSFAIWGQKIKVVEKNHLTFLNLSKFSPSPTLLSAANSDERLKSYGPKTANFGRFGQKWTEMAVFGP